VWALGIVAGSTPPRSQVLHFDGSVWTPLWDQEDYRLTSVDGASTADAWVAAHNGLWHYDGAAWSWYKELQVTTLAMESHDRGWAGGDRIYRYASGQWSPVFEAHYATAIEDIAVQADGTAWAAAWSGLVLRFDGSGWHIAWGRSNPAEYDDRYPDVLHDVSVVSDGDGRDYVWAVGSSMTIMHALASAALAAPEIVLEPVGPLDPPSTPGPSSISPETADPTGRRAAVATETPWLWVTASVDSMVVETVLPPPGP
jgi:hypothetical protein